jgi:Ca2+-transporting ATPase
MAHVLAIRSEHDSLFQIGISTNKALLGAVVLTFVLQLAVIYVPLLQEFFATQALPAADLALGVAISSLIFWGVELEKWMIRRRRRIADGEQPAGTTVRPERHPITKG